MECPVCKEKELKSKVYEGIGSKTCMHFPPYYDEEGIYHHHDNNRIIQNYWCSNGHKWLILRKKKCPAEGCDFGGTISTKILKEEENENSQYNRYRTRTR